MTTTTPQTVTPLKAFVVALGCASLMTGCLLDSNGEVSAEAEAHLAGQIQGEPESGSSGSTDWEGAVVTTHEVDAEGSVGPAVDTAYAEANGEFRIRTRLRGEKALILRAVRNGVEWKARFEDRIEEGKTRTVDTLNLASSVVAEVWLELRSTSQGDAALASEIRAAVEAEAESEGLAEFRGGSVARAQLVARLATAVAASARARGESVADLVARVEAAAEADTGIDSNMVRPRPVLTSCERAAIRLAAMDPNDSAYAELRARFAAHCMDADTTPPSRPTCEDLRARLGGMDPESPEYKRLRLRVAIRCSMIPPPPPLTPCERAAIRLIAMDPDRPAYAVLRARFATHCLEGDPDGDVPETEDSFPRASAEAEAELQVESGSGQ